MTDGGGFRPAQRASAGERLVLLAVVAVGAWLLFVPVERVPMLYDTLGYGSQATSLLEGHGNTIAVGAERVSGIYPAGMPALAALAMAALGPDVRHGVAAVLLCALLTLFALGGLIAGLGDDSRLQVSSRLGGLGSVAALLLLGSPVFRMTSGWLLSQVPTALAVVLVALLYVRSWRSGRVGAWLFAAGLVAATSVLLRFSHAVFPLALGLTEVWLGGRRPTSRAGAVLALAAGGLCGGAVIAAHNVWAFGGPFSTGYALWGFDLGSEMSWRHLIEIPTHWGIDGQWPLTTSFLGLNRAFTPVVSLAAAVGLWGSRRRAGADPRRTAFAALALLGIGFDGLLLGFHSFHSDLYLVPLLPLTMGLAALGLGDLASAWARRQAAPGAASHAPGLVAVGLLALSLALRGPPEPGVPGALSRYAKLEAASEQLPDDAVLLTATDPGLVNPLFARSRAREVVYVPDYVSPLVGDAVARQLRVDTVTVTALVEHVARRLAEGRPVYLDQNPPPRELSAAQRALRPALLERFAFVPDADTLVFRIVEREGS